MASHPSQIVNAGARRETAVYNPLTKMMAQAIRDTGFSNRELARLSGLNRQTISNLVNGRRDGSVQSWNDILQAAGIELGYRLTK